MATSLEIFIVNELQVRIGKITSDYEGQIALLKGQSKELLELKDLQINELRKEIEELKKPKKSSSK